MSELSDAEQVGSRQTRRGASMARSIASKQRVDASDEATRPEDILVYVERSTGRSNRPKRHREHGNAPKKCAAFRREASSEARTRRARQRPRPESSRTFTKQAGSGERGTARARRTPARASASRTAFGWGIPLSQIACQKLSRCATQPYTGYETASIASIARLARVAIVGSTVTFGDMSRRQSRRFSSVVFFMFGQTSASSTGQNTLPGFSARSL